MTTSCSDAEKSTWPELLGKWGEVAVNTIRMENHYLHVVTVADGMIVTMEYRCDRVRVWLDKKGYVKQIPMIG
ncbi:hypothetical protein GIB67_039592 [Kingdonia uniflora]|uniref:Uncharacterized protein n=1 Tax=Kingdonia uniflora TaxID=39325 RepID=A0A7J7P7C6_9MAGN|nr:hypothetical protein GIB67_039592 [Kingdonia uniflora]